MSSDFHRSSHIKLRHISIQKVPFLHAERFLYCFDSFLYGDKWSHGSLFLVFMTFKSSIYNPIKYY